MWYFLTMSNATQKDGKRKLLGQMLVEAGLIDEIQLTVALGAQTDLFGNGEFPKRCRIVHFGYIEVFRPHGGGLVSCCRGYLSDIFATYPFS